MRSPIRLGILAMLGVIFTTVAQADVRLPHIFGSHMVLQRDMDIPVWGWAEAGESVSVTLGDGEAVSATADADGTWRVTLPPQGTGGPVALTVSGASTVTLDDILIGEVWLCSGQSNMEWVVGGCENAADEIASADHPEIRHIKVPRVPAGAPAEDFDAQWQVCTPATAGGFTAVGYFFGKHLQSELGVPIGLVNSSWGGTAIEPWTPPVGFDGVPSLKAFSDRIALTDPGTEGYKTALKAYLEALRAWMDQANAALTNETPLQPSPVYPAAIAPLASEGLPTGLYNGMIAPLVPFAMRGAIWYQGESNHGEGMSYADKTRALVEGWRRVWNQGEFPFYYVQIAPFRYGEEDPSVLPIFWEAQTAALSVPNTGMATISDVGNLDDIHPKNKLDVGKRLALLALAGTYGQDVVSSGPLFDSFEAEGDRLRVRFTSVGGGLASRDGQPLNWFEIAGPGTNFEAAEAVIEDDTIVLSSPNVPAPCALRFAWHKNAEPNLTNAEGLPARPFRAGEVPVIDFLTTDVDEAGDYELIYDLDLADLNAPLTYGVDNSGAFEGAFDRIAYCLDLRKGGEAQQFVYVSMDAFTDDLSKVGVPTFASGASFQIDVGSLNVRSNVEGIVTGDGLTGGNIEFWPNNYGPPNAVGVPNASDGQYDFGDALGLDLPDGYGCMQVHNHGARQVILAVNNWKALSSADLGIGNNVGEQVDWTFSRNAASFEGKRLRVLVRPAK